MGSTIVQAGDDYTWTGSVDGEWDKSTANFDDGGPVAFEDGKNVTFGTATQRTVNVTGAGVTVGNMTVNGTGGGYSFTGTAGSSITGAGLTINTATGDANKVIFGNSSLSFTGTGMITGDGTVQLGQSFTFTNPLTIGSDATVEILSTNTANATQFAGSGTLLKSGAGIAMLTGDSSAFVGTLNVASGTLALQGGGAFTSATSVIVAGVLDIKGLTAASTSLSALTGTGSIVTGSTATDAKTLVLRGASPFDGIISGTGALQVGDATAGNVTLSKAQTYTGLTTITNGVLALVTDGSLAASSGVTIVAAAGNQLDISGAGGDQTIKALNGAGEVILGDNTLIIKNDNGVSPGTYSGNIKNGLSGNDGGLTLNANAAGDVFTLAAKNEYEGDTTISKGILKLGHAEAIATSSGVKMTSDDTKLQVADGVNASIKKLDNDNNAGSTIDLGTGTLTLKGDTAAAENLGSFNGIIAATAGNLAIDATHQESYFTLNSASNHTGATNVNKGKLMLGAAGSVAKSSGVDIGTTGTFDITGLTAAATSVKGLTGDGKVNLGDKKLTINPTASANTAYAGVIDGSATSGLELNLAAKGDTFTLSGNNSYLGKTVVTKGTLKAGNAASVASTSGIELDTNGVFDITAADVTVKALGGSGEVHLGANKLTIDADAAGDMAYSGVISGTTDKGIKIDLFTANDKFTLAGVNTYAGETLVTKGTLALTGAGTIADSSQVVLSSSSSVLNIAGVTSGATVKSLSGQGNVLTGTDTVNRKTLTLNETGASGFTGSIQGAGNVRTGNAASGNVTFSSVQDYSGLTTVVNGSLTLETDAISASSGVTLAAADSILALVGTDANINNLNGDTGTVNLGTNNKLTVKGAGTFKGAIADTANGSLTLNSTAAGTLRLEGVNTYKGTTTIEKGKLALANGGKLDADSAMVIKKEGIFDVAAAAADNNVELQSLNSSDRDGTAYAKVNLGDTVNRTLTLRDDSSFDGAISGTEGSLVFDSTSGNKTLTLKNENTYGGTTTVGTNDKLRLEGDGSIADSSRVILNGATLDVARASGTESEIKALDGTTANVAIAAGNTLTLNGSGALGTFSGNMGTTDVNGNLRLNAVNTSDTFTLDGVTTAYTGNTTIDKGTLKLKGNSSIDKSTLVMGSGGTLDLTEYGSATYQISNALTGVNGSSINMGAKNLELRGGGTYGGSFTSNAGSNVNINGAANSKLTLSGDSASHLGTTTVNGGTLEVASSGKLLNSDVTVNNGAKLTGDGTIGKSVTVNAGGNLASAGTVVGNVTMNGGTLFGESAAVIHDDSYKGTGKLKVGGNFTSDGSGLNFYQNGSMDEVNAGGLVSIINAILNVRVEGAGDYELFTGNGGINSDILSNLNVGKVVMGAAEIPNTHYEFRIVNGAGGKQSLVLAVTSLGRNTLYWRGNGNGNWSDTTWSKTDSGSGSIAYVNAPGTVAVFNTAGGTINVTGTQNFDTMQFNNTGYVLAGDGTLQFATALEGGVEYATISANGTDNVVRIDAKLKGDGTQGANDTLFVTGGGTLILNNHNVYSGGTVLAANTKLQLNYADAAGQGGITLDTTAGGSMVALNFSDNYGGVIKDDTKVGANGNKNTVLVTDGSKVIFTASQDYSAGTSIGKGSSLTAGTGGDLSANSFHYLDQNASLTLASGNEAIGGLAGETGSTLALGGNTLTVNQKNENVFNGSLTGTVSASFIKNGDAKLSLYNVDTSVYGGTFVSNAGTLALIAKTGANMDLRLAAGTGVITAATSTNNQNITLSGTHNGKLEIERGNLVLNAGGANTLAGGSLALAQGVSVDVGATATVGSLALNGNSLIFGDNGSGGLATLTAKSGFTATGINNLYVDSSKLGGATGSDFFTLASTGSETYLINGTNSASSSNFAVRDLNGKSLEGTITDGIVQGGTTVGTAVFEGGVTVDSKGVSYGRKLTEIHSSSSTGVIIDSTTGANAGVGARNIQPLANGQKDMSAKLSGDSFIFQGSDNILVSNANNNYIGSTVVNMASNNTTVTAGVDNAFGSTKLLDIQRGGVNVNNKTMNVGGLSGAAGTTLNLGTSGGTLNIKSAGAKTDENTYAGRVSGNGNIVKSGNGSQLFTNNSNNLIGNITLNGGSLAWNGNVSGNRSSTGNVTVNTGDFIQAGSSVAGNVTIGGSNSSISGWGNIGGDLTINNGGTYKISVDSGRVDQTSVGGKTTFGQGSSIIFNNEALNYMYLNPSANLNIITSGNGFDLSKSPWKDGIIKINMGILGTAKLEASGSSLNYTELEGPTGSTGGIITGVWSKKGVKVGSVLSHSSLGNAIVNTFTRFNTDDAWMVDIDPHVNARFANVKFMGLGPDLLGDLRYSRSDVLSVFNHESGLSATQPVDAAMDTTRTMIGQGIMNRVNSLRAARTILSNTAQMPQNPGAAGSGNAYGSLLVGDSGYINADGSVTPDTAVAAATYAPVYNQGYGFDYRNSSMRVWAGGIGQWSKYDTSSGGIGGYKYNSGGVMVGMDGSVGEFTFGGAFGYTRGTLKDKLALSSSSDIDSYSLSLYSDYNHVSGVNAMFFGGAELFDNDISRRVAGYRDNGGVIVADNGKENSDYRGYGWYLGSNLSYDFLPMDNLTVTPSIGLTYADVRSKAFTRRTVRDSGTVLTDRVSAVKRHSISMPIDVAVTYDALVKQDEKVSILGNVGYAYEFHNKGAKGDLVWTDVNGASPIRFTGRDPGRSAWNFGIGARYQRRNVDFDVKYDYATRKDLTTHRVSASVGFEF